LTDADSRRWPPVVGWPAAAGRHGRSLVGRSHSLQFDV